VSRCFACIHLLSIYLCNEPSYLLTFYDDRLNDNSYRYIVLHIL
jgi:hypothetical protein